MHYEGGFENWIFNGKGTFMDEDGDQYIGHFDHGSLKGKGEYIGKDGSRYQGDFDFGRFNGQGRLQTAEGDIYEGKFRYGEYNGPGTLTYAKPLDNVTTIKGIWRNGELVESGDKSLNFSSGALAELALYNQNELLRKAWQGLRNNNPDKIDMYFLGIAGDGKQAVFRREVLYVQDYFDRMLGTAGRSMVLVNGRKTVGDIPLATTTSIKLSLDEIARHMDPENDILFIYMSSHGSHDFEFTLDPVGVDVPGISADTLAGILAGLPVRWKVIVISACYAGGFIPALQDEHTLIMTAASADRTSFGCSDRAEFTYFGEAYFKDALPASSNFVEAFDKASKIISMREQANHEQHSNPRIYKPDAVLKHLQQWRPDLHGAPKLAAGRSGQ